MAKRSPVPDKFRSDYKRASDKQVQWIVAMLKGKDLFKDPRWWDSTNAMDAGEYAAHLEHVIGQVSARDAIGPTLPMARAGELISALKVLPNKPVEEKKSKSRAGGPRVEYEVWTDGKGKERRTGRIILDDGDTVLAGSYGLPTDDDDRFSNDMSFFRVWVGDRHGWNVQLYVSDDLRRVELALDTKMDVLWAIAQGPEAAAANFGHEFKRCGICGRGLTKDESRARGIGPVCAGRL